MKSDAQVCEDYSDILDAGTDAQLLHFVKVLDAAYPWVSPPSCIERHLGAKARRGIGTSDPSGIVASQRRPFLKWLPRGAGAVAAVVVGLTLVVGAAYSALPVIDRVFHLGGAGSVIERNLGEKIHITQSVNGFSITLERVYADPRRVLIAYAVSGPGNRPLWNLSTGNPTVTDARGYTLPLRTLVADGGRGEPETILESFDATGVPGNLKTIVLNVHFPWIEGMERLATPPSAGNPSIQQFPGMPESLPSGSEATAVPVNDSHPWMRLVRLYGPFTFDVTVPVEAKAADIP